MVQPGQVYQGTPWFNHGRSIMVHHCSTTADLPWYTMVQLRQVYHGFGVITYIVSFAVKNMLKPVLTVVIEPRFIYLGSVHGMMVGFITVFITPITIKVITLKNYGQSMVFWNIESII